MFAVHSPRIRWGPSVLAVCGRPAEEQEEEEEEQEEEEEEEEE